MSSRAAGTTRPRRACGRFARTQPGVEIEPSAVYAAQAAHVVLAALARSDGTRGSVLRELFRVRVRGGLLGDFAFTASGDITEGPITVLRVAGAGDGSARISQRRRRHRRADLPPGDTAPRRHRLAPARAS